MRTLTLEAITKRFGPVLANDAISLTVHAGTVLGLIGENGAGKSTLVSILYGVHRPDSGRLLIDGREVVFRSPGAAIAHGMGMVFQHFQLFADMTVLENVVYGAEPGRWGLLDRRGAERRVAALAAEYGLDVPLTEIVADLPVGVLQRVEILKALYRRAEVLILDEPTGVLTPPEARALFRVLRRLADQGHAVLLITHKLDEIIAVADEVVVLRDGRRVFDARVAATTTTELARHLVGRDLDLRPRRATRPPGDPVLVVDRVSTPGTGRSALSEVSVTVRSGEIVAVAGVAGNGQETLAAVVAGHRLPATGTVTLAGTDVTTRGNDRRRAAGLAHIPEDRNGAGVAAAASAIVNLAAGFHRGPPLGRRGRLSPRAMRAHARELIARFGIRVADPAAPVQGLSGGNVQKLVVARELAHRSPFLLAEQPTRGIDLGAIEFVYRQLDEFRAAGGAVLLISSELTELLALGDRVVVLADGRIAGEFDSAGADPEIIGALMAGGADSATADTREGTAGSGTVGARTADSADARTAGSILAGGAHPRTAGTRAAGSGDHGFIGTRDAGVAAPETVADRAPGGVERGTSGAGAGAGAAGVAGAGAAGVRVAGGADPETEAANSPGSAVTPESV
ncbi:ABC transporter ATP-binding protein [Nocardia aurantia]|uniref:Vitamin B12 import ATP-binding protein BtuD n=1 Tax=Nocardia aurantia TaxID=2585199 RepID=A0A7K0DPZ0_9NOCA|nr:ABC transporter ATP-binding protein [Nocardia aurantia]MQY27830.1 Vitamin B12 import ATP-binding protein BtuD [Nocardia aurantia]